MMGIEVRVDSFSLFVWFFFVDEAVDICHVTRLFPLLLLSFSFIKGYLTLQLTKKKPDIQPRKINSRSYVDPIWPSKKYSKCSIQITTDSF
ncbi:ADP-ribosylglycohydrolase [Histoplasma ohiense]|nr:ADP-ribosylglycohydrolase [Histoplasma ohiense (nom. inval.)]